MRSLFILVAAIWGALAGAAQAQSPVVVELFTSQGCSSCPPADALFKEIAGRDDVIALGLHVDYWDYIGWKDIFADPRNTARQRAYARVAGDRSIYTPQMIIGGRDHIVGNKPMKLAELLAAHAAAPQPAAVTLARSGDRVTIRVTATGAMPRGEALVQLVTYVPEKSVRIQRGENAGRTLDYANIVRDWVEVGRWDGRGEFRATVRVPDGMPLAVLVQERGPGPILGAAKLR